MEDKIQITDNMPEDLKAAINYLNENNISLTDKINIEDIDDEEIDDDDEFVVSEADLTTFDYEDDDDMDLDDDDVDLNDLNSIF